MNIIATIIIFIAFGSLCFWIGCKIGRGEEQKLNEWEEEE